MGLLESVVGVVEGAIGVGKDVVNGVKEAIDWAKALVESVANWVWTQLIDVAHALGEAWTWVVNGVEWLGETLEGWAAEVYNTLAHIITEVIPNGLKWIFGEAVRWAARALHTAWNELRGIIKDGTTWLEGLVHKLVNAVTGTVHKVIGWVTDAVNFIKHWGAWILNLLTHPENLAKWIVGSIVEPIAEWLLKTGAHVIVWLLRKVASEGSEIAHLIEQVLADML